MNNNYNNLNLFFQNILLKKQYILKLKNKVNYLNSIKNISDIFRNQNKNIVKHHNLVKYIIDITFSKTNTLLHVIDFSGNLKVFSSAGSFSYNGRNKKSRRAVLKDFYKMLVLKLQFLKTQPIALHLKNVRSEKFWIFKRLKKKFFIKTIKIFNNYSYNGCRKKKIRRKKIRTKKM
jgi:ribosomal protein S11